MGASAIAAMALLIGAAPGQAEAHASDPRVLVHYDFDGEDVETGPWTLVAYENARGSVRLTSDYRLSGWRSVEVRDVAGDGDFAELQGFFRELSEGLLHLHFALLLAEPGEPMNVALAGESHFRPVRDGIGFWLQARQGRFEHVVAGENRVLAPIQAFTWYVFDVVYDVAAGRYDLTLRAEGQPEPIVALQHQPNAVGIPGSRVHKFSFIGDPPGIDSSDARFYIDDLLIAADRPYPAPGPFVAPGRRMLFVDLYRYYRQRLYALPGCPPTLGPADFGFQPFELRELAEAGLLERYDALADRRPVALPEPPIPDSLRERLQAMALRARGCAAPQRCEPGGCASDLFQAAQRMAPGATLYPMSRVLALAGEGRWPEADALLLEIYPSWERDPRFPALAALLGLARGELGEAEAWLDSGADRLPGDEAPQAIQRLWSGQLDQALLRELQAAYPLDWADYAATALAAEHRFWVRLLQGRADEARAWATRLIARLEERGVDASRWYERRGDALFELGDSGAALHDYERSLRGIAQPDPIHAKLADVYFRLGDLAAEREHRERVYGSLRR